MKNKKMAVAGISLLGSIGVISTGFAGWIITAPAQHGSGTGAITADGTVVSNGTVSLGEATYGNGKNDAKINFAPNAQTAGKGWLTSNEGDKEDLQATVSFAATVSSEVTKLDFTAIKLTASGTGADKFNTLITNGVIGSIPTLQASKPSTASDGYILMKADGGASFSQVTYSETNGGSASATFASAADKVINVTFEIHFAWGTNFSGSNPMDHYNLNAWSAKAEAEAKGYIEQLKNISDVNFNLSFSVAAKKA